MHILVRIIVPGADEAEAISSAEICADDMTGEHANFDWYSMDGRWGLSKALKLESKAGQASLNEALESQRKEFDTALRHIRYMLDNYTEDNIYNETFDKENDSTEAKPDSIYYLSRYMFQKAGTYDIQYLYGHDDIWGGSINNERELKSAIKGRNDLWIVPIDFHY